jgi:heterodisulfide reductase subunit A-like polyferredoxin
MLSPKLVDAGRHLNIQLITNAELKEVSGEAGRFKAKIVKKPRYIDIAKCTGCGECAEVCPIELPSEFDQGLIQRKAIFRPFAQAYPSAFAIDKKERPPCGLTCPAGINVQGYVALIAKGKYQEALSLIKESVPLPGVLGRICPHPCEEKCNRGLIDEPISIRNLKRFAADHAEDKQPPPSIELKEEKVAIIGSGPAGLTCAYYLAKEGYRVTVFEALPVVGGMLYVGIPEYRLPKKTLETEVEGIKRLGVEIKTNVPIGKDLTIDDLFNQGYKAIFIGVGAHQSQKLGVPGENAEGVIHGVDFLRELNLGKEVKAGKKVVVIGGGDVAIDAARCALRLGSEVFILYRRSRQEMPAREDEIVAAESEGVKIEYLVAPTEVLVTGGEVSGLRCIRMELGEPDASGRRRPIPIKGSEFDIEVDMLIPAIGQAPDLSFLARDSGIEVTRRGTLVVDPITLATSREGVFSGGDCQTGPGIAIEAIAAGKRAAISIARCLKGEDIRQGRELEEKKLADLSGLRAIPWGKKRETRQEMPTLPQKERAVSFKEIELGFTEEAAIQEASRCLSCGICSECLQCVAACKAGAINHEMSEEIVELDVGSVILCPGLEEFDASLISNYGYKKYPNVVTSIEFERILSATGPYQGRLLRPSDNQLPQRIAWIQCVGSRDEVGGKGYCSSVCCTYAIKEAIVAKEHSSTPLDETIFFMDMRTCGKDFDRYYERAKGEQGIRFTRSKIYGVSEVDGTGDLAIKYVTEDGKVTHEDFNLVVLSVGFEPSPQVIDLGKKLGIQLNKYGFCSTSPFTPVESSKPGIFVCGAFSGPKDIPETVMQASGAAAKSAALLAPARNTLVKEKEYPPEIEVSEQDARIGVFICHCGINIGGVVNVPEVKEYVATLPNVVFADENLYTCSQDTQERIKQMIEEHHLNRVVVASCTPRTHEPLFQETIREAGLNRYLFEMANIRDQCSWVHRDHPEEATEKAKDLVKMAVAKARLIHPLKELTIPVIQKGLIIGGGIAGMIAALELADQGFECFLIERGEELGGNLRKLYYTLEGLDTQQFLQKTLKRVEQNKLIHIFRDTHIKEISGYIGNFATTIKRNGQAEEEVLQHGVIIVATGGEEYKPSEYLYGKHNQVLTQQELEQKIATGELKGEDVNNVVMIQCVGSRDNERPYCSKVCCSQAIKNALKIKELNPSCNIYILYKDMRTYGFREEFYGQARSQGVLFIRYDDENKPEVVSENGRLRVGVRDPILNEGLVIDAELVALSAAIIPTKNDELARMLKVPLNEDGFFLEAHVKLRPVDFATDGIFVCGLAHSPKPIDESISQAIAAVGRAAIPLSKGYVSVEPIVSRVDEEKCIGCGLCESLCAFNAIRLKSTPSGNKAENIPASCKGCGLCAASCPQQAITMHHFTDDEMMAEINALAVV